MDTSPQYIEMCRKARELFKGPDYGDYYATQHTFWDEVDQNTKKRREGYLVEISTHKHSSTDSFVAVNDVVRTFLPRQDQLQEMVKSKNGLIPFNKLAYDECYKVCIWRETDDPNEPVNDISSDTFEQAWLCFVMREKFKKTWNGTDWVKI